MKPLDVQLVKVFCGILWSNDQCLEQALGQCRETFGPIDFESPDLPFDVTDYYVPEMGTPIFRRFVSFEPLRDPGGLADWKLKTNAIEERLQQNDNRRVNLDIGYLDYDKVVLASAKYNGQKVYIGDGIYADLTLHYSKGGFEPFPWAFPDFRDGRYDAFLLEIRRRYKLEVKS